MNQIKAQQLMAWKELRCQASQAAQALDFQKSESLLLRAYTEARRMFGPDHGEVGLVLMQLLDVTERKGKDELIPYYRSEIERIADIYKEAGW